MTFEQMVKESLERLPPRFAEKLENVEIIIEDEAPPQTRKQLRISPQAKVFGLYQGVPLKRRGVHYGNVLPDRIVLYQKTIESVCATKEGTKAQIEKTLRHEIAHHFGFEENQLRQIE